MKDAEFVLNRFLNQSFNEELGEEKLKKFINATLRHLADIDIPIKRGTFIEYRTGMLNISPIGRNCSQAERDEFEQLDHVIIRITCSNCGLIDILIKNSMTLIVICHLI